MPWENAVKLKTFEISPEKDFKDIEDKDENAEIAASLKKEFLASYQVNGNMFYNTFIVLQ